MNKLMETTELQPENAQPTLMRAAIASYQEALIKIKEEHSAAHADDLGGSSDRTSTSSTTKRRIREDFVASRPDSDSESPAKKSKASMPSHRTFERGPKKCTSRSWDVPTNPDDLVVTVTFRWNDHLQPFASFTETVDPEDPWVRSNQQRLNDNLAFSSETVEITTKKWKTPDSATTQGKY